MSPFLFLAPILAASLQFSIHGVMGWSPVDPLVGFTELPLNESNFEIQWPYNVPVGERYSFIDGIHKLRVLRTDIPHAPTSNTSARTEIRILVSSAETCRMEVSCLLILNFFFLSIYGGVGWNTRDPTDGFVSLPLNTTNFHIQKPYNLPVSERYRFIDGVHKFWVLSTDKPLSTGSPTLPRSEILIEGYDYSSGVWQFEGHGYVPSGTSGVCIMQVFGAVGHATTLMMRVYEGALTYYKNPVVVPSIYDRWFRLNVIHDVDAGKVQVYIDGVLKLEVNGRGGASHYFKCGVYAQNDASYYMESRWKGVKVLKKSD